MLGNTKKNLLLLSVYLLTWNSHAGQEGTDNRVLIQSLNDCAAMATALGDTYEKEFYSNATIDAAFELCNGKTIKDIVVKQISLSSTYYKKTYNFDELDAGYHQKCGYGVIRGYATWYKNWRDNK